MLLNQTRLRRSPLEETSPQKERLYEWVDTVVGWALALPQLRKNNNL